jgi:hypothetical protein
MKDDCVLGSEKNKKREFFRLPGEAVAVGLTAHERKGEV